MGIRVMIQYLIVPIERERRRTANTSIFWRDAQQENGIRTLNSIPESNPNPNPNPSYLG